MADPNRCCHKTFAELQDQTAKAPGRPKDETISEDSFGHEFGMTEPKKDV